MLPPPVSSHSASSSPNAHSPSDKYPFNTWYKKKSQADRRIKSSKRHRFKIYILSIRDTRKSLRLTEESTRRHSIASKHVSFQYVIQEKVLGRRKNHLVDIQLPEANEWFHRREQKASGKLKNHAGKINLPEAFSHFQWKTSICLRQSGISSVILQFAWSNFVSPVWFDL